MLYEGDSIKVLTGLLAQGVQWDYCLTSPPYFSQIDYELDGQYGLEPTAEAYIEQQRSLFRLVYKGMTEGGVCWIVVGDTSNNYSPIRAKDQRRKAGQWTHRRGLQTGFREKEPLLIPYRLAMALRADGWVLRKQLIWDKGQSSQVGRGDAPPETHESVLMLGKARGKGRPYFNTKPLRSTVLRHNTSQHPDHPCPFPYSLAEELLSSCRRTSGCVLDPYLGTGTTLKAAQALGMQGIGIDLTLQHCA